MFRREKLGFIQKLWMALDKKLIVSFFDLLLSGFMFVFTASIPVAERIHVTSYFFIKKQIIYLCISIFLLFLILFARDYISFKLISLCLILCILLLICVFFIGFSIKGAKRWLYIFGISIQPSEIIKPFLIIVNAFILDKTRDYNDIIKITACLAPFSIIALLLYLQPDIGILMLLTIVTGTQIFLSNIKTKNVMLLGTGFIILLLLCYVSLPHIRNRIDTYIKSLKNINDSSYQVAAGIQAFRQGGYLGRGFLEGKAKNYIPDAHTDFIFPVIVEEFGLIFVIILLSIYLYIGLRVLLKTEYCSYSNFKSLAVSGLVLLIIYQCFINIGVTLSLLPTKGMTLPFLSYGGSSLIGNSITYAFILIFTQKDFEYRPDPENLLEY